MNSVCLQVSGIANNQIKTSLKNALDKIDGVQTVDIDKTLGRVEVGFNQPATEYVIRRSVEETGLTLE